MERNIAGKKRKRSEKERWERLKERKTIYVWLCMKKIFKKWLQASEKKEGGEEHGGEGTMWLHDSKPETFITICVDRWTNRNGAWKAQTARDGWHSEDFIIIKELTLLGWELCGKVWHLNIRTHIYKPSPTVLITSLYLVFLWQQELSVDFCSVEEQSR